MSVKIVRRTLLAAACETRHKLVRALAVAIVVVWAAGSPLRAAQAGEAPVRAEAGETQGEGPGHPVLDMVARLVNFAILAGSLWYLLKSPIRGYLDDRGRQIRADLVNAAEMKQAAATQIEEIDRKMKALPAELDALRAQGAQEIAAEEARIRAAAAAERERLLEQARREIELQVRVAKKEILEHAANLSVQLATERIQKDITPEDQRRLVDRYLDQMRKN